MTIFRWIVGALTALFALGSLGSFVLYMAFDGEVWLERTRRLRHWLWVLMLFWFNIEVWGRVAYTLYHWVR